MPVEPVSAENTAYWTWFRSSKMDRPTESNVRLMPPAPAVVRSPNSTSRYVSPVALPVWLTHCTSDSSLSHTATSRAPSPVVGEGAGPGTAAMALPAPSTRAVASASCLIEDCIEIPLMN